MEKRKAIIYVRSMTFCHSVQPIPDENHSLESGCLTQAHHFHQ
jgi:hypothetical protein